MRRATLDDDKAHEQDTAETSATTVNGAPQLLGPVSRSTTADRPLRRDAERNRRLILEAAREEFAERGLRASHDDIARRAGVGVGTVYRRFPDKEQLIDALFEQRMEEIAALADEGLEMEDPWDGLVHFFVGAMELQPADRGLKELALGNDCGHSRVTRARERIGPRVQRLVERARAAGVVRGDLEVTDLPILQLAAGAIADAMRDVAPDVWRRTLTLVLDGLRPARSGTTPLPEPALDQEQFATAMRVSASARRR